MAIQTDIEDPSDLIVHGDEHIEPTAAVDRRALVLRRTARQLVRTLQTFVFSNLTRRIVVLNLAALAALVSGILFLNQFRAGLIDARVESLLTQGEIIAGAIVESGQSAGTPLPFDPEQLLQLDAADPLSPFEKHLKALEFAIDPERVAPILRRVIVPTKTRARIYDRDGILLIDSRSLGAIGQAFWFDIEPPTAIEPGTFEQTWRHIKLWIRRGGMPVYRELNGGNGNGYPEVTQALDGSPASIVRVTKNGELIVSVAVPVRRHQTVLGGLLLSTEGDDIDAIVRAERLAIFRLFVVAATITIILSVLLAGTIAGPIKRLAGVAERVKRDVRAREEIPDFPDRRDEISHLASALRDMTNALYDRIAAIEAFAADVSHELKNPLTSLRSAVETLPLVADNNARERLLSVIQHDVQRLDRLISDISDASRLDAELQHTEQRLTDLRGLIAAVVALANERQENDAAQIVLSVEDTDLDAAAFTVRGSDSRLSQVIVNLLDNARSFAPKSSQIRVTVSPDDTMVRVQVDDEGLGIQAVTIERIFERFYTDRPAFEDFGNHSGLGLSISKQIIEAHGGDIRAENRIDPDSGAITGARFIVRFPVA
jgi:two-component system sensor histidine kinase ChvG